MPLYDAFISYSHAKDKPVAAALQSAMQRLGKPWYKRRALRVFRDDTSLSATPSLWPSIEQALSQSRFLVLLASPEAAASQWVNKEVAYWLDHKGADTLLIALTDGELAWDSAVGDFGRRGRMPLPPALAGRFPSEPKWVDLAAYRDGADARDAKFTEAAADFAAAIHGIPKEDLLSQELRQQRGALRLAWGAAGSLLFLAGVAGWQAKVAIDNARVAVEQRQIAEQQRDRAERTLAAATRTANTFVFDMAQEFRDRQGMPADLIRKILDRAQDLQRQLTESGETSPSFRTARLRRSPSCRRRCGSRAILRGRSRRPSVHAISWRRWPSAIPPTQDGNATCPPVMNGSAKHCSLPGGARRRSPPTPRRLPSMRSWQRPSRKSPNGSIASRSPTTRSATL